MPEPSKRWDMSHILFPNLPDLSNPNDRYAHYLKQVLYPHSPTCFYCCLLLQLLHQRKADVLQLQALSFKNKEIKPIIIFLKNNQMTDLYSDCQYTEHPFRTIQNYIWKYSPSNVQDYLSGQLKQSLSETTTLELFEPVF